MLALRATSAMLNARRKSIKTHTRGKIKDRRLVEKLISDIKVERIFFFKLTLMKSNMENGGAL